MKAAFFWVFAAVVCGCSAQEKPVVQPAAKASVKKSTAAGATVISADAPAPLLSGRSNPFLSLVEERSFLGKETVVELSWPVIDGIVYAPSASRVIVGASVLGVGDDLDGRQIVRIEPEAVYLRGKQGEYVLRLRNIQ